MRVLAIDSSGLTATVAIVEDDTTIAEFTINYKKTHSQTLLPMIDEMVKMVEADLNTIDAIAVAGGPGSFTGLRIGSATAKGLGLALGKPLIHIPTADAMAYSIYGCEDIICPIMDARRNQVYTGIYSFVPKKESEDSEHGQMKYAFSGNTCTDGGFSGRFDTKAEYLWTQSRILGRWSTCISQDAGKGSESSVFFCAVIFKTDSVRQW